MEKVRWGILGISGIARRRTVPEMVAYGRLAEVAAVVSRDEGRARSAAEEFGVPRWYTTEEALLADANVEAVYVATPNHLHRRQVLAACAAGKHVLCEKPLAPDVGAAEEVRDACRKAGVKLGVAFMMRFHALHRKAAALVAEGGLGRPVMARAQLTCWYPRIEGAWRQVPDEGGGGSLVDLGSHCIDLLEMVLGSRVREVSAFQGSLVQDYPVEDTSVALLRFGNGAVGIIDNCFNVPDAAARNRLEVYGTCGSLLAEGTIGQGSGGTLTATLAPQAAYEANQVRAPQGEAVAHEVCAEPVPLYAAQMDRFSECIRTGAEPEANGDLGVWNERVVAAIYEAARTGRTVAVG